MVSERGKFSFSLPRKRGRERERERARERKPEKGRENPREEKEKKKNKERSTKKPSRRCSLCLFAAPLVPSRLPLGLSLLVRFSKT